MSASGVPSGRVRKSIELRRLAGIDRFGIRSIPTLVLFEKGRERERVVGVRPAAELRTSLDSKLQAPAR